MCKNLKLTRTSHHWRSALASKPKHYQLAHDRAFVVASPISKASYHQRIEPPFQQRDIQNDGICNQRMFIQLPFTVCILLSIERTFLELSCLIALDCLII
jgi:hypothetical protein